MTPAELLALALGSNVLTAAVTTAMTKGLSKRSVKVDEFDVITDKWAELHKTLEGRVTELERSLGNEEKEHETTRNMLRVALRHIRDVVAWSAGTRLTSIPEPPAELLDHF